MYAPAEVCGNSGNLILITSWNIGTGGILILQMKKPEARSSKVIQLTTAWGGVWTHKIWFQICLICLVAISIVPRIVFGTKKVFNKMFCKWVTITGDKYGVHEGTPNQQWGRGWWWAEVIFWRSPFFTQRHNRWLRVSQMKVRGQVGRKRVPGRRKDVFYSGLDFPQNFVALLFGKKQLWQNLINF